MSADLDRLKMLFESCYRDNAHERSVAASALYAYLIKSNVHPAELKFELVAKKGGEFTRTLDAMTGEIRRLSNQLEFAKQKLNAASLKTLAKIGGHVNHWPKIEDLLLDRIVNDGHLPRGWKQIVADTIGCTTYMIDRFQEGTLPVPDDVLEKIVAMPVCQAHEPKPKRCQKKKPVDRGKADRGKAAPDFTWTPEVYQECLTIFQQKKGMPGVRHRFPMISEGQINRKLINNAPDETLLAELIIVRDDDGPMTFLEYWKIGYAVTLATSKNGSKWKTHFKKRFGLSASVGFDDPTYLSARQRFELRKDYRLLSK